MKTAFKILPSTTDNKPLHLLAEASGEGISFLFYTKEPLNAAGVLVVQFDNNLSVSKTAEVIKNVVADEPALKQSFHSTNILHNVKECTLVPQQFHHPMMKEDLLTTLFGSNRQTVIFDEHIRGKEMVNVYRVGKPVAEILRESFPFSSAYHSNTLLLPQLAGDGNKLYCIVSQKNIKVVLQKENALLLTQQFSYQTAVDVVYHLLNVCKQHDLAPENVELILSGMIDEASNLYKELYKYFLQIGFATLPEGTALAENFEEYPAHFFHHLILLASCV